MRKSTLYDFNNCRDNPAVIKAKLLKFSNEVLDRAVDALLESCDKNKIIIEGHCNKILHLITLNECEGEIFDKHLEDLKGSILRAREELGKIENFVTKDDIEQLSMLVALASESTKGFYRLRKTYLKVYQSKIDPVVDISVQYLNEPVITMKNALKNMQDDIEDVNKAEEECDDCQIPEGFKYVEDYKELNSLAITNGFMLIRCNGDHGIFRNDKGYMVVIPQGRTVGKGLSILIQKTIYGKNLRVNKLQQNYKI